MFTNNFLIFAFLQQNSLLVYKSDLWKLHFHVQSALVQVQTEQMDLFKSGENI